jgi:hypothetical protein
MFLDDMPLAELEQALGIPIHRLGGAADLVAVCSASFHSPEDL